MKKRRWFALGALLFVAGCAQPEAQETKMIQERLIETYEQEKAADQSFWRIEMEDGSTSSGQICGYWTNGSDRYSYYAPESIQEDSYISLGYASSEGLDTILQLNAEEEVVSYVAQEAMGISPFVPSLIGRVLTFDNEEVVGLDPDYTFTIEEDTIHARLKDLEAYSKETLQQMDMYGSANDSVIWQTCLEDSISFRFNEQNELVEIESNIDLQTLRNGDLQTIKNKTTYRRVAPLSSKQEAKYEQIIHSIL